ncbi:MAG: hypothetical protein ACTSU5_10250 [Promethearchaeota archaeon]
MAKKKEDFLSLWKKDNQKTPSTSIIAGLQQQIAQKDSEIERLNEKMISLKTRINEDIQIMEQTEVVIKKQQEEINRLKSRAGGRVLSSFDRLSPPSVDSDSTGSLGGASSSTLGAGSSGPQSEEVKQYKLKIKELEDKIYIFSQLPDRITKLEEKNAKLNQMIDDYERNEQKLMETIKKLTLDEGGEGVVGELQEKVERQKTRIKALEKKLEEAGGEISLSLGSEKEEKMEAELKQMRDSVITLTQANNDLKMQLDAAIRSQTELEAKNDILRKTVAQLQASSGSSSEIETLKAKVSEYEGVVADLEGRLKALEGEKASLEAQLSLGNTDKVEELTNENLKLKARVKDLEEKNRDASIRFENLVAKVQESQRGDPTLEKLHKSEAELSELQDKFGKLEVDYKALKAEKEGLLTQVEELRGMLEEAQKAAKAPAPVPIPSPPESSPALVDDLQKKLNRYKGEVEKLKAELEQVDEFKRKATEADALKRRVEELEEQLKVEQAASSGGDMRALVTDLQKRLSHQKALVQKLTSEKEQLEKYREAGEKAREMEARMKELEEELAHAKETAAPAAGAAPASASPLSGNLSGLVQELQRKMNHTKVALRNREERIKELEQELGDYRTKSQLIERQMKEADERLAMVKSQEEKLDAIALEISELKAALGEKTTQYEEVRRDRDATKAELEETKRLLADREAELRELEDRVAKLREALASQ